MAKGIKKNLINDATIELLSKFEILRNLSKDELKKLLRGRGSEYEAGIARLVRYEPDETVIREGDFDSWSFWIVTGSYNVVIAGTIIANLNTPGDIFGEMSVLDGIPRTASVVAVMEGICLGIDMSILSNLDDEYITHIITSGFQHKKLSRLNITHSQLLKDKQAIDARYSTMLKMEKKLRAKEAALSHREEELRKKEQEITRREAALFGLS
ncbi:MAG: cyclic nucleotide-binding domain-containing protein [Desulfamplus sp.]|nr:cyclic nucleotide-binding domain-containing protein [Desulfamplus sp.]